MVADGDFTYKQSGVDVAAGNEAVRLLKERLRSVHHPLVLEGIGGFAGLLRVPPVSRRGARGRHRWRRHQGDDRPRDGRLRHDRHRRRSHERQRRLGLRRDAAVLLDYLVVGKVDPQTVADIVGGVDEGCLRAGCALLGGGPPNTPATSATTTPSTWPALPSASPAAPSFGVPRESRPATPCWASPRTACTPTASRWYAPCSPNATSP